MRIRNAVMLGAGALVLGLAGAQVASADSEHARRGHGYGHGQNAHGGNWGHGKNSRGGQRAGRRHHSGSADVGMGPRFAMLFDLLDVSGDGKVSRDEALRAPAQQFARLDADGDGAVSADEVSAAADAGPGRFDRRMIEQLDADADGQISKAEFELRARSRFAGADANDDGAVSFEEFAKAGPAMRDHARLEGGRHRGGMGVPMMRSDDSDVAGEDEAAE